MGWKQKHLAWSPRIRVLVSACAVLGTTDPRGVTIPSLTSKAATPSFACLQAKYAKVTYWHNTRHVQRLAQGQSEEGWCRCVL